MRNDAAVVCLGAFVHDSDAHNVGGSIVSLLALSSKALANVQWMASGGVLAEVV